MNLKGEATIDLQTLIELIEQNTAWSDDAVSLILSSNVEERYNGYSRLYRKLTLIKSDDKAGKEGSVFYVPIIVECLARLTSESEKKARSMETLTLLNLLGLLASHQTVMPLGNLNFEDFTLTSVRFDRADLRRSTFIQMRIVGGVMNEADFSNSRFENTIFKNVSLDHVYAKHVCFRDVTMDQGSSQESKFHDSEFRNCEFRVCNFTKVKITACDLSGTTFEQCKLTKSDFAHSNMAGANLINCDVSGANFYNTDLRGADLRQVYNVKANQFENAIVDDTTMLPASVR